MKGDFKMSYQEIAKDMIDKLPADKMIYVINILENLGEMYGVSLYPNYEPNKETVEAIEEVDKMIKEGTGEHFEGNTVEFLSGILGE